MSFEAWESYFWPCTQVLRNKLDERDPEALAAAERELVVPGFDAMKERGLRSWWVPRRMLGVLITTD